MVWPHMFAKKIEVLNAREDQEVALRGNPRNDRRLLRVPGRDVGASDIGHEAQDGLECPRRSTEDVAKRHNRDTRAPHTHLYPVAELRSRRCRIPVITHGPTCRRYPLFKMIWSEGSLLLPI